MQECKTYRVIMLLSVLGKIFNSVNLQRLKTGVDDKLRDRLKPASVNTGHALTK